jgi:hypothetical protein
MPVLKMSRANLVVQSGTGLRDLHFSFGLFATKDRYEGEESFMTKWIGAAILALTLLPGGSAAINPAAAEVSQAAVQKSQASQATDFSARRRYRHYYRYGYRPYYRPHYYDRPYYYRPYPYYAPAPFPFGFGFGFGPWW